MIGLGYIVLISYSVFLLCATDTSYDKHVREYSRCAFPCDMQRSAIVEFSTARLVNVSDDPRILISLSNTTMHTAYCIERSGPFILSGRTVNGVNEYACWKNQGYESGTISIYYYIPYKPYSGRPDICEVCNGQNMNITGFVKEGEEDCAIVIPKELDCNIPWYCPVVNATTQKQCGVCELPLWDEGLCCDKRQ